MDVPNDPEHKLLHKVNPWELKQYLREQRDTITTDCGKTFAPSVPLNLKKPQCPLCFKPFKYAISA